MDPLKQVIEQLQAEAAEIQIQGRKLSIAEEDRVRAIFEAITHLEAVIELLTLREGDNMVTYKISNDVGGKLKQGARTACNFWNQYVIPAYPIVIRLGTFTANGSRTIARAYRPSRNAGVTYGRVEFNTYYLSQFSDVEIAGTITHEIGHTLGFGFGNWDTLFNEQTGKFLPDAVADLATLEKMLVELDYGRGTALAHWDEETFTTELMTGLKNQGAEHVLPVTIDVMDVFGHQVIDRLNGKTDLTQLLTELSQVTFLRQEQAKLINRDHFEETELMETIPHGEPLRES